MSKPVEPIAFGRYQVIAEIGRGAMGLVYKASDPTLNRLVAIKTINLNIDPADREGYEARFTQEARSAGGLNHPNIVTIYDLGSTEDLAYIAMEYLDGKDLATIIDTAQPLPISFALSIALQTAEALCHAHEKGIVHRDIKPANIMVVANNVAKLTDFGIARLRSQESRTQTSLRVGSPLYMSPEQVLGHRSDPRSDIFSLGVVLYEMLTGRTPFGGSSMESIMYQTINIAPTVPGRVRPEVPQIVDLVVARMLDKVPENRYVSARELADDLAECLKVVDAAAPPAPGNPFMVAASPFSELTPDQVRMVAQTTLPPVGSEDDLPDDELDAPESLRAPAGFPSVAPLAQSFSASSSSLLLSRDFDSTAATRKLAAGLSSPADQAPSTILLGGADSRAFHSGASTGGKRGFRLSRQEVRVSVTLVGAGLLVAATLLVV